MILPASDTAAAHAEALRECKAIGNFCHPSAVASVNYAGLASDKYSKLARNTRRRAPVRCHLQPEGRLLRGISLVST